MFLSAGSKAGTSPPISQHRLVNITQAHFASTQPSWKYSLIYTSTGLLILILVIVSITFYQNFNRKSTKNNLEQSCKYIKVLFDENALKKDINPVFYSEC